MEELSPIVMFEGYWVNGREQAFFISRYYPSDYMSILSTFCILKDYDFSLSRYIIALLEKIAGKDDFILRLLFGLYLLCYADVGRAKSTDLINFDRNMRKAERRKKRLKKYSATGRYSTWNLTLSRKTVSSSKKEHGAHWETG